MRWTLRTKLMSVILPVAALSCIAVYFLIESFTAANARIVTTREQEVGELSLLFDLRAEIHEIPVIRTSTTFEPDYSRLRSALAAYKALHGVRDPEEALRLDRLERMWAAPVPLSVEGRDQVLAEIGKLIDGELTELKSAERDLLKALDRSRFSALWAAAGIVLGGLLLTLALSVQLTRPISDMLDVANAVADGSLDARVDPRTRDEIGLLGLRMNEMLDRLAETMESRGHFIAEASHELRTPVTILRGETEVALRAKDASVEDYRDALETILSVVKDMETIVDDLLTLARAESGNLTLSRAAVDLSQLAAEVTASFETVAAARNTSIELSAEPTLVTADGGRMRQVMRILLDNAIKYSPRGSRVAMRIRPENGGGRIEVQDWGRGISKDALPFVFERYFRASRGGGTEPGGTGLGLPIARAIVYAHGGRISLESRVGEGTTVTAEIGGSA